MTTPDDFDFGPDSRVVDREEYRKEVAAAGGYMVGARGRSIVSGPTTEAGRDLFETRGRHYQICRVIEFRQPFEDCDCGLDARILAIEEQAAASARAEAVTALVEPVARRLHDTTDHEWGAPGCAPGDWCDMNEWRTEARRLLTPSQPSPMEARHEQPA